MNQEFIGALKEIVKDKDNITIINCINKNL